MLPQEGNSNPYDSILTRSESLHKYFLTSFYFTLTFYFLGQLIMKGYGAGALQICLNKVLLSLHHSVPEPKMALLAH